MQKQPLAKKSIDPATALARLISKAPNYQGREDDAQAVMDGFASAISEMMLIDSLLTHAGIPGDGNTSLALRLTRLLKEMGRMGDASTLAASLTRLSAAPGDQGTSEGAPPPPPTVGAIHTGDVVRVDGSDQMEGIVESTGDPRGVFVDFGTHCGRGIFDAARLTVVAAGK